MKNAAVNEFVPMDRAGLAKEFLPYNLRCFAKPNSARVRFSTHAVPRIPQAAMLMQIKNLTRATKSFKFPSNPGNPAKNNYEKRSGTVPISIDRGPKDGMIRACLVRNGQTNEFASWRAESWETFYTVREGGWLVLLRQVRQDCFIRTASIRPVPAMRDDRILVRIGR